MPYTQEELQTQALDKQATEAKKMAAQIGELIKKTSDPKERLQLLKTQENLLKQNRSLSGDLKKNFSELKDGIVGSFDGFVNNAFGPLGGMITSMTSGFLKRGKENQENIDANQAQLDLARESIDKIEENGGISEKSLAIQEKTFRLIQRQPTIESQEEE